MLVIISSDELMYIGEENNDLEYKTLGEENILVNAMKYKKVGSGNQIVKNIEFCTHEYVEKECEFTDYESEDGKKIISLAKLKYNNKRSDIIAEIITIYDLKFNMIDN